MFTVKYVYMHRGPWSILWNSQLPHSWQVQVSKMSRRRAHVIASTWRVHFNCSKATGVHSHPKPCSALPITVSPLPCTFRASMLTLCLNGHPYRSTWYNLKTTARQSHVGFRARKAKYADNEWMYALMILHSDFSDFVQNFEICVTPMNFKHRFSARIWADGTLLRSHLCLPDRPFRFREARVDINTMAPCMFSKLLISGTLGLWLSLNTAQW